MSSAGLMGDSWLEIENGITLAKQKRMCENTSFFFCFWAKLKEAEASFLNLVNSDNSAH